VNEHVCCNGLDITSSCHHWTWTTERWGTCEFSWIV